MIDDLFEVEDDVRVWMREFAALPINGNPLPDARQLWWKAELLKRWDAQRQAVAPIEQAEPLHITIGVTGAIVLLAWLWRSVPSPNNTLMFATILSLAMLVAVAVLTLQTPVLKVLLRLRSLSGGGRSEHS
jgi:hypothetical protein